MRRRLLYCSGLLLCAPDLRPRTPEPVDTAAVRGALLQRRICPGGTVRVVADGERCRAAATG